MNLSEKQKNLGALLVALVFGAMFAALHWHTPYLERVSALAFEARYLNGPELSPAQEVDEAIVAKTLEKRGNEVRKLLLRRVFVNMIEGAEDLNAGFTEEQKVFFEESKVDGSNEKLYDDARAKFADEFTKRARSFLQNENEGCATVKKEIEKPGWVFQGKEFLKDLMSAETVADIADWERKATERCSK